MSTTTFDLKRPDLFPEATSVGAYPASSFYTAELPPAGAPRPSAAATATVTSGVAAFTGLTANTAYFFAASVSGTWRYVKGRTDVSSQSSGGGVSAWTTGTSYTLGQVVTNSGKLYQAADAHTAGATFAGDLATHWTQLDQETDALALAQVALKVDALSSDVWKPTTPAAPRPGRETVITTFQSGHGFAKTGGSGTVNANSTTQVDIGSQSLQFVTGGDNNPTAVTKSGFTPIDLSAKFLKVRVWISDPSKIKEFSLYISSDAGFANFAQATVVPQTAPSTAAQIAQAWIPAGGWYTATLSRGDFTSGAGTLNWASVNTIRIRVGDTGSGNVVTAYINKIAAVDDPPAGMCSIVFDDGHDSIYTKALPALDALGIPTTQYLIADVIDTAGTYFTPAGALTTAQLKAMRDKGHEIASHAASSATGIALHNNGFDAVTIGDAEADIVTMKKWLTDRGFASADQLALPLGRYSPATLELFRRYFRSVRTVYGHGATARAVAETLPPADACRLRCWQVNSTDTPATLLAAIDKAIANREWLILLFHKVVTTVVSTSLDYLDTDWATFTAGLAARNIDYRTVGDVLRQQTKPADASAGTKGLVRLSQAPVSPAAPIAVSDSDPRITVSNWIPASGIHETHRDRNFTIATMTITGGVIRLSKLPDRLIPGKTYNSISFFSVGAATAPTNQWFAVVRQSDGVVLAVTVDDTTAAWGANAPKTLALTAPYTPAVAELVYLAVMVKATTAVPTLIGSTGDGTFAGYAPAIGASAGSGLTTPPVVGSNVGAMTANFQHAYGVIS